ncbi:MAG: hydroxyacid dehydrogenase [Acidobacteria bacterium]|nr:hydroxyacid dehydrogenase [Acidobacteriota bacterium]MCG3193576.1 Hydroxypyruvate reductase [Thermoanaerobaculia bacterium]MCK6685482.1 hydroxyacid dehydrogenase [Thermoanaerobaculia bacterium]
MKILLADSFDESLPGRLSAFGEVTADPAQLSSADVLLVRSKTKVTREYLDGAPNLKLVIRGGVGLDNIDVETCRQRGIEVKNTPRASSVAVAELTLALMLAIPNRLVEGHMGMKDGKWLKKELKRTELFQKTLGLLGAGLIGTEVARRAQAFGMRVIAHDQYIANHALAELVELDELFAQADYISIHLPLTNETRGMINRHSIAQMKDGVIIVNTARGKVVDEKDLADALKSGKVRAYGTDVFYGDPPDPTSPILSAPSVVMTPHIGGSSQENLLRIGDNVVELLKKWKRA